MKNSVAALAATAVSGLSNVFLQLLAAHLLSADDYARFALAASTVLFVVGLSRALVGQTDLIRGKLGPDCGVVAAAYELALVGLVAGIGAAIATTVFTHDALLVLSVALLASPCFILQDSARFRAFRVSQAHWALASDLVVLLLAVTAFLGSPRSFVSAGTVLLVWGGATGVGFLIMVKPLYYIRRRPHSAKWWRDNRDVVVPGGAEYLLQTTVPYLLNWVILALGGASALAGYRIVQLVFASLGNLAQGLSAFELPQISASPSRTGILKVLTRNALVLVIPAIVLFVVIGRLPAEVGTAIFGNSWYGMSAFLLAGAIHGFINALQVTNYQILRILGEAKYSLGVRVVTVVLIPVVTLVLGTIYGAIGIAWGLALVTLAGYGARLARTLDCTQRLRVQ